MDIIKKEFRRELRKTIAGLDEQYLKESNKSIFNAVSSLPEIIKTKQILVYCSEKNEIDTLELIKLWQAQGKQVAMPVCLKAGIMYFAEVNDIAELVINRFGIYEPPMTAPVVEPSDTSVVIVPGLTYDYKGYRMGQGGGYYDRWLPKYKVFSIGVARDALMCDEVPREGHDCRVDCVVSETRILRF